MAAMRKFVGKDKLKFTPKNLLPSPQHSRFHNSWWWHINPHGVIGACQETTGQLLGFRFGEESIPLGDKISTGDEVLGGSYEEFTVARCYQVRFVL